MKGLFGDRVLGLVLLVFAVAWSVIVVVTIPTGFGDSPVGPRGFPLGLGVLLAGLSGLLVVGSFMPHRRGTVAVEDHEPVAPGVEIWAVLSTVGLLVGYTLLLGYTGFIIGTTLTVAGAVLFILRMSSWRFIFGMSLGMSLGIYLVFGKLLGVYLPHGSWVDLYF